MLMAFPVYVSAQEETDNEQDTEIQKAPKVQVKKYETRTVKGRVIDSATGNPVSGAIVKASGVEGYSTLTDDQGVYTFGVPVFSSTLFVSTPDHGSVTVGLTGGEMQKDVRLYGTFFGNGSVETTNVTAEQSATDFQYSSAANIKDELQKQLGAYAFTTTRNGTPGVGAVTFVQGLNSVNVNAQPLVVVDGVIMDQQYDNAMLHSGFFNDILSSINTRDIADIKVLRNGTALYGARGANGVIQITTRRSKSMSTRITASLSAGVSFEPKYYSMMDAEQYRGYASELLKGTGTTNTSFKFLNEDPTYYYYKQYHNNTDWKKEIYRTAMTQNYGINVEGGDEVAQYNLSVGYISHQSTLDYNDMDRLNVRFNTDIALTSRFDVRFDASFSNTTRNIRDDGAPSQYVEGTPTAPSFLAYVKSPFLSPYAYGNGQLSDNTFDTDDEIYLDEALAGKKGYNYKLGNPAAFNLYADAENKNRFENSLFNIAVTPKYRFGNNLTLSEHFSYTLVNTSEKYYIPINGVPSYYVQSVSGTRDNEVSSLSSKHNSVQSDTRLSWAERYNAHDVSVFGGARLNFENFTNSTQLGYNTGSDKTPFMGTSLLNSQSDGYERSWRTLDWYVQGNYNYLGRYYAQVNLTATGSSRFGKEADGGVKAFGARWAIFPSVQGSWVLTNEPWLAGIKGLDYLKLTAGYDISGNDNIDIFAAQSYFASTLYLSDVSALSFSGIGNTKIKWETTKRFNAGLEAMFLDSRVFFGFNFFTGVTSDLLSLQQLSFLSGLEYNWANSGKMKNTGFDFTLKGRPVVSKDWNVEVGASLGHYKNEITSLPNGNYTSSYYGEKNILTAVGQPAGVFYGYQTSDRVFASTEEAAAAGKEHINSKGRTTNNLYIVDATGAKVDFEAGDVHFIDQNGDGEISELDKVIIGDPNPDVYGNIFASVGYKRFKLDLNFNYCVGNDVFNYMRQQLESGSRFLNQTTTLTQRWMSENQITAVPRITFDDPMGNSRFSDRWIEDGSYLRLKSVTLSYKLPMNSTFLQGLEFWIQGNNLFTVTKYLGTDPEFSSTSAVIGQGVDTGCLSQSRSVIAGVKINL